MPDMSTMASWAHLARPQLRRQLVGAAIVAAGTLACGAPAARSSVQSRLTVRLGTRVPLAAVQTTGNGERMRVAIAGVISPTRTLEAYRDLLAYLDQQTGQATELVQRPTYSEINHLLQGQAVQVGFVCTLAYIVGQREFGLERLVAPLVNGRPEYYSLLIVRAGHPAERLAELQGTRFAFTDPLSNSGRLAPAVEVRRLGVTPERFFSRTVYTYSHDHSVIAVADGLVDAAAVDNLVYEGLVQQQPELGRRTRVIARWGPFGIPPVVVPPGLSPEQRDALRAIFLRMEYDDTGRRALSMLRVERFAVVPDAVYDTVRQMADLEAQV